jgi:glycerol-3-phosphate dehydrogenase
MFRRLPTISRRTTIATVALTSTALSTYYLAKPIAAEADPAPSIKRRPGPLWSPPSREQMLKHLKSSGRTLVAPEPPSDTAISEAPTGVKANPTAVTAENQEDEDIFDLLIVGGGATGAGVALDAASRGLKVACVEREDFSSGEEPIRLIFDGDIV